MATDTAGRRVQFVFEKTPEGKIHFCRKVGGMLMDGGFTAPRLSYWFLERCADVLAVAKKNKWVPIP